jgi:hypothetical protein
VGEVSDDLQNGFIIYYIYVAENAIGGDGKGDG